MQTKLWQTLHPNSGTQKAFFKFYFFGCISTKNMLKWWSVISQCIWFFANGLECKNVHQTLGNFAHPNSGTPKTFFKFYFFSCILTKICWSGDQWFENSCRDFSKHFLLPLFGGKNSIINWVSKLNPPSFIISITHISLQLLSSISNTLSTRKARQRRICFQCFLL